MLLQPDATNLEQRVPFQMALLTGARRSHPVIGGPFSLSYGPDQLPGDCWSGQLTAAADGCFGRRRRLLQPDAVSAGCNEFGAAGPLSFGAVQYLDRTAGFANEECSAI